MLKSASDHSLIRCKAANLVALFAILVAAILLPGQAAQASTTSYDWSNWELRVDFPAPNTINALFIVRVGHYAPDSSGVMKEVADIVHAAPIPCTPHGDVLIDVGIATFDNGAISPGHILCTLPNYAAMVRGLTGGTYSIGPSIGVVNPWVTVNLSPIPGDAHPGPIDLTENPIFYHPDIQLSTPSGINPGTAHLHFSFNGNHITSDFFNIHTPWNSLWAGHISDELFSRSAFWSWATHLNPADLFGLSGIPLLANGTRLGVASTSSGTTYPISTKSTTVCIGCDLDAGTFFDGTISRLSVDPGNYSNH